MEGRASTVRRILSASAASRNVIAALQLSARMFACAVRSSTTLRRRLVHSQAAKTAPAADSAAMHVSMMIAISLCLSDKSCTNDHSARRVLRTPISTGTLLILGRLQAVVLDGSHRQSQ